MVVLGTSCQLAMDALTFVVRRTSSYGLGWWRTQNSAWAAFPAARQRPTRSRASVVPADTPAITTVVPLKEMPIPLEAYLVFSFQ